MDQLSQDVSALLRPVVYALVLKHEVVYVGKAQNGLTRLYTHQYNWKRYGQGKRLHFGRAMEFDAVRVWPCKAEHLSELEQKLIDQFRPKHNVLHKRPGKIKAPIVLSIGRSTITLNGALKAPLAFERRI